MNWERTMPRLKYAAPPVTAAVTGTGPTWAALSSSTDRVPSRSSTGEIRYETSSPSPTPWSVHV